MSPMVPPLYWVDRMATLGLENDQMTRIDGDLQHRLATLRASFAALGGRAAGAARSLTATVPPAATLLEELGTARSAFTALRTDVLQKAGALSLVVDADSLGCLRDLEPVLASIAAAEAHRARVAVWDEARQEALGVLDRVTALIHHEDRGLPALEEAQNRARELHATLSGPPPTALEEETKLLPSRTRPYAELLALVEGWNVLDDDRCAALQDAITESFGRPLSLAALRGKLGRAGDAPPPAARPRARASVAAAPSVAEPSLDTETEAHAPIVAAPSAPPALADVVVAAGVAAPSPGADVLQSPGSAEAVSDLETAAAVSLDAVAPDAAPSLDPIQAPPEREAELERLAVETAPWWIAARNGWQALAQRGVVFRDAAHDYLTRFPYLLAVPLPASAEYEGGQLAEGYGLLLAHIEKHEEGFVTRALERLSAPFAAHDPSAAYPLAQELYLYVIAEGRLYKTYPDFVREVVGHTVPRPGAWVQGGIVDGDDETRLFMRAERPGSTEEQTRTLTERNERLGPHVFRVTLAPLTTRFFTLGLAGETLADPPDVEIKLTENGAPTDHAWLTTLPALGQGKPGTPRKQRTGGTTLEELGPQFSGFWMAVFNADPRNDRDYELSIILRRKPPPLPDHPPAPDPQHFFGKKK
jgi:hypothetical protein